MSEFKMPPMEEHREPTRFTQQEDKTYAILCNPNHPEYLREFIRYMWYGRIPVSVWNDAYLRLDRPVAVKLMHGAYVPDDQRVIEAVKLLTEIVRRLIARSVLPCADTRALPAVFRLGYDVVVAEALAELQQQQEQNAEGA